MKPPSASSDAQRTAGRRQAAERVNALTHLAGAVLALAGGVALILMAAQDGDPWKVVSVSVYGATLVGLYSISTLYHGTPGRFGWLLAGGLSYTLG